MPLENKFSSDFFEGEDTPRAARLRAMMNQSPRDRTQALSERQSDAAVCDRCGSNWFQEVEYNQYKGATYSSAPGGEIEQINQMPMRIRVCLCGKPYRPNVGGAFHGGRTPLEQMSSFQVALEKAIAVFETVVSTADVTNLLQSTLNQVVGPYEQRLMTLEGSSPVVPPAVKEIVEEAKGKKPIK
jgi:hypothetical protein